jgi:hypothetical protein
MRKGKYGLKARDAIGIQPIRQVNHRTASDEVAPFVMYELVYILRNAPNPWEGHQGGLDLKNSKGFRHG